MARRIADRYTVGPPLGAGGMGTVHEALDERLDREVAIKLVPLAATSEVERRRFVREARAAARVHHPNAVAVFDAGDADGQLYLVMELVRGSSLAEELAARGRFDVDAAVAVVVDVLAGLDAAHAAGVVHRDVKPGNVMRTADGTVKVVDFGIAHVLDDRGGPVTSVGEFVGTPRYVAPEQVAGEDATPATDVYATGVLLHELLTGEVPYDRGSPLATAIAHRDDPIPDVRARRPEVSPALAAVVARAMAKDPVDRYPTAGAMRRALREAATSRAAVAPVSPTVVMPAGVVRDTRARRRRSVLIPVLVVAALLGVVALAAALVRGGNDDPDGAVAGTAEPSVVAAATTVSVATTTSAPPTVPPPTEPAPTEPAPTEPAPTTTTTPATAAPTDPPATDAPAPPELPVELEALIIALGADPAQFGVRTNEVIERLGAILTGQGSTPQRVRALREDVQRWRESGELSPEVAEMVLEVLEQLPQGNGDGAGNGNGNGNGGGNGGDEDD